MLRRSQVVVAQPKELYKGGEKIGPSFKSSLPPNPSQVIGSSPHEKFALVHKSGATLRLGHEGIINPNSTYMKGGPLPTSQYAFISEASLASAPTASHSGAIASTYQYSSMPQMSPAFGVQHHELNFTREESASKPGSNLQSHNSSRFRQFGNNIE